LRRVDKIASDFIPPGLAVKLIFLVLMAIFYKQGEIKQPREVFHGIFSGDLA
jgi:hypothetical protein